MPNIRNASASNIVFLCNICEKRVSDKNDAIQCYIYQAWIHLKCNKVNHINYKYLQGSSDPWFCLYCCRSIFPFRFSTNKGFSSTLQKCVRKCFQEKQFYPFNISSQSCSFV